MIGLLSAATPAAATAGTSATAATLRAPPPPPPLARASTAAEARLGCLPAALTPIRLRTHVRAPAAHAVEAGRLGACREDCPREPASVRRDCHAIGGLSAVAAPITAATTGLTAISAAIPRLSPVTATITSTIGGLTAIAAAIPRLSPVTATISSAITRPVAAAIPPDPRPIATPITTPVPPIAATEFAFEIPPAKLFSRGGPAIVAAVLLPAALDPCRTPPCGGWSCAASCCR